jgi:hypothetical protein
VQQLGVPEDEIARVITTHPSLLELSAENLEPKVGRNSCAIYCFVPAALCINPAEPTFISTDSDLDLRR